MSTIRVLLADDHAVVRSGLRNIFGAEPDMEVVAEASDGAKAIELALEHRPSVVVLDVSMPNVNGIEATRRLLEADPSFRILVLTMYDDEAYLREFLELGAAGYVLKTAADDELVAAVRAVSRGESFIHPSLSRHLIQIYLKASRPQPTPAQAVLSTREREVLRLVALGYSGQEIASQLSVSSSTVETHRAHISEKLGLKGRAQLVRYAMSEGLLDADA